jgi:hypothetical protein
MAWTTPRTWVAGELVHENDLNVHVRDNLLLLKTPISDSGQIIAINATFFESLDGTALTGVGKLATANDFTVGTQNFNAGASTRVVLPVGVDKWAV